MFTTSMRFHAAFYDWVTINGTYRRLNWHGCKPCTYTYHVRRFSASHGVHSVVRSPQRLARVASSTSSPCQGPRRMSKVYPHGRDRQSRRSYTHGNKSSSLGTQQGPIKVTPELTKSLMSRIAHPVAVVTTSLRTEELEEHHRETDGGHSPHLEKLCAMTVSSINTVTVSPETVLAFNIRLPSKTFTALSRGRQFLVHFLTASRQGRGIGEFFAKGKASYGFSRMDDVKMNWKCNDAADGAPQITDPAVLACVRCTIMLDKCVYVGDHVLVLAKAQDITIGDGQVESGSLEFQGGPGLSYMLRDYRYMGSPIEGLMSSGRLK